MVNSVLPFDAEKWKVGEKESKKLRWNLTLQMKAVITISLVMVTLILVVLILCFYENSKGTKVRSSWFPTYVSDSRLGNFSQAAIATDAAVCAPIGREILEKGGSVVDSAIATLFCMGASNPESMGLGGGFFMMFYNRSTSQMYFLDAREKAPLKATENMFEGNSTVSRKGKLSIAVPGELIGYTEAHSRFGRLPWGDLVKPTIDLCRKGVPVNRHLAKALKQYKNEILKRDAFKNIFIDNTTNDIFKEGSLLPRPDLASTLESISRDGSQVLYGEHLLTEKFVEDLKAIGSIIEKEDMAKYKPRLLPPAQVRLRNNMTLYSTAPPGSGVLLGLITSILDGYEMNSNLTRRRNATVLAFHRILEAFKFAYARRMEMEDDFDSMKPLIQNLTSAYYADQIRAQIDDFQTYDNPFHYGLKNEDSRSDHGTAHLSIVSPDGDAVSVTSTINHYFGSLEMSPSTGILLNNEMDDFSAPNITSYFEVPPTTKNLIKPERRPMSSMCPAIIVDDQGDVRLVTGGNGGTQITTSVFQVLSRVLWFGENIKEAIDAPRFHHQLLPNHIIHEKSFPESLLAELRKLGHKTVPLKKGQMVGIVLGITRDDDGRLYANSDYRKNGAVDGY